jgi:hypothetical protein
MSHTRRLRLFFFMALLPAAAHSQEASPENAITADRFDTEHIFGFAEGSDIGPQGEGEI